VTGSLQIIATLVAAQIVIAMAPGPNTLLVVHASAHERRLGLAVAAGIWPVGILWAVGGLLGLGTVLTALPEIAEAMRIACGLYLVWLGMRAVRRSFVEPLGIPASAGADVMTAGEAFRAGALSTLTNPKAIAYYLSIFTATGAFALSPPEQALVVILMPTVSSLWYALLATVVASRPVAGVLDRGRGWFDRLAGLTMIGFGAKLLASRN
jgi:threonine/homoserine/homoserine lactone efflux protein